MQLVKPGWGDAPVVHVRSVSPSRRDVECWVGAPVVRLRCAGTVSCRFGAPVVCGVSAWGVGAGSPEVPGGQRWCMRIAGGVTAVGRSWCSVSKQGQCRQPHVGLGTSARVLVLPHGDLSIARDRPRERTLLSCPAAPCPHACPCPRTRRTRAPPGWPTAVPAAGSSAAGPAQHRCVQRHRIDRRARGPV